MALRTVEQQIARQGFEGHVRTVILVTAESERQQARTAEPDAERQKEVPENAEFPDRAAPGRSLTGRRITFPA
jgi:hypothetical protein